MSRQEDFIEAGIAYRMEHGKPMWIAVRPEITKLKDIKCPNCGLGYVIETGEVINNNEL